MTIYQIKRAYDPAKPDDGFRIYVDRLWPQGLSHQTFHYDLWEKDLSPSSELREWFHADPEGRWTEFAEKYHTELMANPSFAPFKAMTRTKSKVTLLYSSRNRDHNNAVVLLQALEK